MTTAPTRVGNCLRAKCPSTVSFRNVCIRPAAGIVDLGPTRRAAASGHSHQCFQSRLRTPHGNFIT
jgi:hypothetical protein